MRRYKASIAASSVARSAVHEISIRILGSKIGSLGSGFGTLGSTGIPSAVGELMELVLILAKVTTAEQSHLVNGKVEVSEIAGLLVDGDPHPKLGSQGAIRGTPNLRRDELLDRSGPDRTW